MHASYFNDSIYICKSLPISPIMSPFRKISSTIAVSTRRTIWRWGMVPSCRGVLFCEATTFSNALGRAIWRLAPWQTSINIWTRWFRGFVCRTSPWTPWKILNLLSRFNHRGSTAILSTGTSSNPSRTAVTVRLWPFCGAQAPLFLIHIVKYLLENNTYH